MEHNSNVNIMNRKSIASAVMGGKQTITLGTHDAIANTAFTSKFGRQPVLSDGESPVNHEDSSTMVHSLCGSNDASSSDKNLQDFTSSTVEMSPIEREHRICNCSDTLSHEIRCSLLTTNTNGTQDDAAGRRFSAAPPLPDAPGNDSIPSTSERSPLDTYLSERISESDLQLLREEDPTDAAFLLQLLTDGRVASGDCGVSLDSRPAWVDAEKIRLGQQFAQNHFFGLVFAEMLSLFVLFSIPCALDPFILSGNSDTPFKAFRRYLSTVARVREWYSGDLWASNGEPRRHLRAVRRLHALYRRRFNDALSAEGVRNATLRPPLWTRGVAEEVRGDFRYVAGNVGCPFYRAITDRDVWINQMEMAVTQFGFMGLMVSFPERFGAGWASEKELDAFVHVWCVLGHLLGIEERFNFCAGGLEAARRRSRMLVRVFLAPAMAQVGAPWEHMTRCVVEGVRLIVGGSLTYEIACATVQQRTKTSRTNSSRLQTPINAFFNSVRRTSENPKNCT